MSTKPKTGQKSTAAEKAPRRHTFSVKGQLRGKLGEDGLRRLLDRLEAAAKPRHSQRRRSRS